MRAVGIKMHFNDGGLWRPPQQAHRNLGFLWEGQDQCPDHCGQRRIERELHAPTLLKSVEEGSTLPEIAPETAIHQVQHFVLQCPVDLATGYDQRLALR